MISLADVFDDDRGGLLAPLGRGTDALAVAAHIARRERAALGARAHRHTRAVRLRVPASSGGRRGQLAAAARSGIAVLEEGARTTFDLMVEAAGLEHVDRVAVGASGALMVRGRRSGQHAVVRVGRAGPSDPSRAFEALGRFEHERRVPAPLDRGTLGVWIWTVESCLHGRRPRRVDDGLLGEVVDLLATWPTADQPPDIDRDVERLAQAVPRAAPQIVDVASRLSAVLTRLPGMVRHGDLWHGNLLVDGGRLSGVVDWDGWDELATPGTDVLHLVATAERRGSGVSFGEHWCTRPWERPPGATSVRELLGRVGVVADTTTVDAVAIAWWLGQVAGDLGREPALAHDEPWIASNVMVPLDAMQRWSGSARTASRPPPR